VPFLNIPRWPEEKGISPAEAAPPGLALCAEDSVFSLSDQALELNREVASDAREYAGAESNSKRDLCLRQVVSKFLLDPLKFEAYADELNRLAEYEESEITNFKAALFEDLRLHSMQPGKYTEQSLGGWLELMVKRLAYREQAAEILSGMFASTKGERDSVDFLYTLGVAGIKAGIKHDDPEITRQLAETFLCQNSVVVPSSRQAFNLWIAMISKDDEVLKKRFDLASAVSFLGIHFAPEAYEKHYQATKAFREWPETERVITGQRRDNPKRLAQIMEFLLAEKERSPLGRAFAQYPAEVLERWPGNFIFGESSTLREVLDELAIRENEAAALVWLQGKGSRIFEANSDLGPFLLSELQSNMPENGPITRPDGVAALYYLTPMLSSEKHRELSEQARSLRERIYQSQQRYVSPSGDKFTIEVPLFKGLGFESILFEEGTPRIHTNVTLRVGNFDFKLTLDRKHNLRELNGERGFPVATFKRGFFEQLVLGYFHALVCGEELVLKHGREGCAAPEADEAKRAFNGMRGHRRKLPAGQRYSDEQVEHYLREKDGDLRRLNLELGLTRETGQITYVKAKDPPNGKKLPPFKLSAKNPCAGIQSVLPEYFMPADSGALS